MNQGFLNVNNVYSDFNISEAKVTEIPHLSVPLYNETNKQENSVYFWYITRSNCIYCKKFTEMHDKY